MGNRETNTAAGANQASSNAYQEQRSGADKGAGGFGGGGHAEGDIFASSGSLNLFGGPRFDDYLRTDRESLFSNSSYFN